MALHGEFVVARAYFPIATIPRSLDIVWCSFPQAEIPGKPGPKPRPALVRSLRISKDGLRGAIEVTYGTSKYSPAERPHDLHICNMAEMAACGLPQATCFILDRTVVLPWSPDFFTTRDDGTGPVIGHLNQTALMQLEAVKVMRRKVGYSS